MTRLTAPYRRLCRLIYPVTLLLIVALISSPAMRRSAASASKPGTEKDAAPLYAPPSVLNFGEPTASLISASLLFATPAPAGSAPASGLVGLDSISIGSTPALIDSFDSAKGQYGDDNKGSAAVVISNGAVSIEGSKVYGDVRSTASGVTLKSSSLVTGNVTAAMTITNGGTVKGTAKPNSPSSPVVARAVEPCSPFSPASSITGKFTYNAVKGDLKVNGTATLSGGSYCFHSLTLAGGGNLTATAPATIRLTGQFTATGNSSAGAGGVPANLQILSSYVGVDGVLLSGTTDLYLTIYAPQAGVSLTGTPRLYGSVLGKTLSLTGNPSLHFDSQLAAASPANASPLVNAGSDQTITLPATATLSGGATDDGLPNPLGALTYQWSQVSGPAAASIANPTQASTTVSFTTAGAYVFTLTASDGALSSSASVQVIVNPRPNQAPTVSAGADQTVTLPATATLNGDAQMEIVTLDDASANGTDVGLLQAWKPGGQLLWRVPLPRSTVVTKLSVADVDRDGRPDILFGIFNTLWVVDQSGHIKWLRNLSGATDNFGFQFAQGQGSGVTFPVYDLNGDGIPEIVVQYGNNTLRFLRGDIGEDETSWTYTGSPVWSTAGGMYTPVVADVDGSGHASVLFQHNPEGFCGCETLVQVLRGDTVQWQPAPTHYNQEAYWESNFNADGTVPTAYARQTADPRTNVFGQQPQAPYAPGFVPATDTSFNYSATNAAGLASTAKVNIHITPQNRAPKFTSKPPTAYVQGNNVDYEAHAVDPDLGDTVTYGLAFSYGNNAAASVDPNTGLVHLSRLNGGDQSFIVSATDNHGAVSYQPFILHKSAGFASVPDLAGMTQADAASSLTSALLSVGSITQQYTNAPAGTVLGQSPFAGTTLPQGESVDLTVSLGPAPVAVPNVIGNAGTVALTTLSVSGFTATTTQVFSDATPAGTIISQTPPPGTFVSPAPANPVALTVSAGNGLQVSLDCPVATADQTITVTPQAFDLNGNSTAPPPLSYSVTPKQTPFTGPLPMINGATITLDPATTGSFTVTATDAANSRTASADFAVLPPPVPGQVTNGESFAHMSEVLSQIHALKPQLKAALAAHDTAQMTSLLQQIVTLWRTVDIDDLRISVPLATADKFPPTVEMMAAFGERPTPDDLVSNQVLQDSIADLDAWTAGLKTGGLTVAQLNALADQFSTRAARMDGLVVSRYGGINNSPLYTRLMSNSIPDFYEALTNELAQLTGMPRRDPSFPFLASNGASAGSGPGALASPSLAAKLSKRRRETTNQKMRFVNASYQKARFVNAAYRRASAQGTEIELLVTEATQMIVDKIMESAQQAYKNAKQYALDVMLQANWTAQAVKQVNELRDSINGKTVDEVFSGASLSFREFQAAPAWIEADAAADPKLNNVFIIGPNLAATRLDQAVQDAQAAQTLSDLIQQVEQRDGLGALDSTQALYKNLNERKTDLSKLMTAIKNSYTNPDDPLAPEAKLAMQSPDEVLNGCLLPLPGNAAACRQLVYRGGFAPVYAYTPPPGFGSLGGLPVGIIFVVHNKADGVMSFGTPPFLPCTYTSGSPKKIQCPNSASFPP